MEILPLTASDIPAAVDLLYDQKISLAINRLMWKYWPDEAAQKSRITSALESSVEDPLATCLKIVDPQDAGETLGLLVLTRKHQTSFSGNAKNQESQKSNTRNVKPLQLPPAELNIEVLDAVVESLNVLNEEVVDTHDYLDITALVIRQSVRRTGLGSQLMQAAFEKARTDQIPIVVCSEPDSNDFFVKLKFKLLKHHDLDLSKFALPYSGFGMFRLTKMIRSA